MYRESKKLLHASEPRILQVSPKDKYEDLDPAERLEAAMQSTVKVEHLSEDQKKAHDYVTDWFYKGDGSLLTLGGYAGTGKSTLVSLLAKELGKDNRIAFCAFTGKATNVLRSKLRDAGVQTGVGDSRHFCGTIHSLFYRPLMDDRTGAITGWEPKNVADDYDLIIVDEASMVDDDTLREIEKKKLPVLAVGDHGQLPPVNRKGNLMANPIIRLDRVHRQALGSNIIKLSQYIRENGDLPLQSYEEDGAVEFITHEQFPAKLKEAYDRYGGPADVGMLVYTNKHRVMLNEMGHFFHTQQNSLKDPPAKNSCVICLRNKKNVIFNGMRGFVEEDMELEDFWFDGAVHFPEDNVRVIGEFLSAQFNRPRTFSNFEEIDKAYETDNFMRQSKWGSIGLLFDYGYALTVHKSQGSSFKHVFLVYDRPKRASNEEFARWLYTGVTRSVEKLTIIVG